MCPEVILSLVLCALGPPSSAQKACSWSGKSFRQFCTKAAHSFGHLVVASKVHVVPYSITSIGLRADPSFLAVTLQVVGCHYFPPFPSHGYFPSQNDHPLGRYQIILLGDRGTQVWVACPRLLWNDVQPGIEPATCESQVHCPTNSTIAWPTVISMMWKWMQNYVTLADCQLWLVSVWCEYSMHCCLYHFYKSVKKVLLFSNFWEIICTIKYLLFRLKKTKTEKWADC